MNETMDIKVFLRSVNCGSWLNENGVGVREVKGMSGMLENEIFKSLIVKKKNLDSDHGFKRKMDK